MRKIKLLLVDNSEIFCEGLAKVLQYNSIISVVWTLNTVSKAVEAARKHKPDIVFIDIQSPQSSNVETIQRIRQILPHTHIIVLTYSETSTDFFSAISAGATGYILKDISSENFVKMLSLVLEGNLVIASPMAKNVIELLKFVDSRRHQAKVEGINLLSKQERAVLTLIMKGASNKTIASMLYISENTVKVHVHNIMDKLNAHNRVEARLCALQEGLLLSFP